MSKDKTKKIVVTLPDEDGVDETMSVDRWGSKDNAYFWYENDVIDDGVFTGVELTLVPMQDVSARIVLIIPVELMQKKEKGDDD